MPPASRRARTSAGVGQAESPSTSIPPNRTSAASAAGIAAPQSTLGCGLLGLGLCRRRCSSGRRGLALGEVLFAQAVLDRLLPALRLRAGPVVRVRQLALPP